MMKSKHLLFFGFWITLWVLSCNRDDFSFSPPSQKLEFSVDTLVLDTVYHQVRSETYAVKIYNRENKDILIPSLYLDGGSASPYRINVDGKAGTSFQNIPLRKKDSLYIFVEIAPIATSREAIAEDRIKITSPAGSQHITLLSVVQDVEFLISTHEQPKTLSQNTLWDNSKAKIIYGNVKVAEGKTLRLSQGTKVYFHKNAQLTLQKNAQLIAEGDLGNEVLFRGERNDARHDTLPLNWGGIYLEEGAYAQLNYTKIMGGHTGITLFQASAQIKNSLIHTFQSYGILGIGATLNAENLVMNNCGEANLGIFQGGNYHLQHATLANYWSLNGALPGGGIYASNEYKNGNSTTFGPLNLLLKNSIVYTERSNSIQLKPTTGQVFSYLFENCLLKYDAIGGYAFDGNAAVVNSLKNTDPLFQNYFTEKMNLRVKNNSPAKGKGKISTAQSIPLDLLKINRTNNPTLGAYQ